MRTPSPPLRPDLNLPRLSLLVPCRWEESSRAASRSATPAGCWTTSWRPSSTGQAAWPTCRAQAACPTSSTTLSPAPPTASLRAWPSAETGRVTFCLSAATVCEPAATVCQRSPSSAQISWLRVYRARAALPGHSRRQDDCRPGRGESAVRQLSTDRTECTLF